MGASQSSLLLAPAEIHALQQETGFSASQIKSLYGRFQRLDRNHQGAISVADFEKIPELVMNPLMPRIVQSFVQTADEPEATVNFEQFLKTLSVFLPATREFPPPHMDRERLAEEARRRHQQKLDYMFRLYDVNNDGYIDESDLTQVLRMMVTQNITDEGLQAIAEKTISQADRDGDGKISIEEFALVLQHADLDERMTAVF
eukprot:m.8180 g.8180  ORF g.8180 m.8180 type:complete len:202 (+) comp3159_c0_seq2:891-1496(+)